MGFLTGKGFGEGGDSSFVAGSDTSYRAAFKETACSFHIHYVLWTDRSREESAK